jgi:ABC-2 type transport system permease protein
MSFIPPIGNFVMILRLTSTSPPPLWQALLAIAVGALGVWFALWFAAKIFRVGLLMYGKPPTFGTLIRWARMS